MRNTKMITIPGIRSEIPGQRDNTKTFLLTEMAAKQAQRWADRAFLALARSGLDLPPGIEKRGMAGIAQIAHLVGHIRFPDLDELNDELMRCIQFVPDPHKPAFTRALVDAGAEGDDIEEVSTRYYLTSEVIDLHTNFLLAARIFSLIAAASTMTELTVSENTSTSTRRSARSSRAA